MGAAISPLVDLQHLPLPLPLRDHSGGSVFRSGQQSRT